MSFSLSCVWNIKTCKIYTILSNLQTELFFYLYRLLRRDINDVAQGLKNQAWYNFFRFKDGSKNVLIGLILHTISWCNGEWVGFSLGISMKHLLRAIIECNSKVDLNTFSDTPLDISLRFNQIDMGTVCSKFIIIVLH